MSPRLIVSPAAETDLRENLAWYEQRSAGLGFSFIEAVEKKLVLISNSPGIFRKRVGPYRLAATDRFLYPTYFISNEAAALITIRRILHFKQDRRPRLGS